MALSPHLNAIRGHFVENEPMHRHCSWRTGGSAERYFEPADCDDLVSFLTAGHALEPLTWLGLGSNVLIRDGGIAGTVISTAKGLSKLEWLDERRLALECGVACAKVAREAARRGLKGAGFLAGIPGTIGGALAMNAGAFGAEIWEFVESARVINRAGRVREVGPGDYEIAYRSVAIPAGHWFLGATLRFQDEQDYDGGAEIKSLLATRAESQPTGIASCGSVFKNPPNDYAGRLIEAVGLKGYRHGGATVSAKHANFIVNEGDATSSDIEALIALIQQRVRAEFDIWLEPEVRVIGEQLDQDGSRV